MRERILDEDALKYFWDCEYFGRSVTAEGLAGVLSLSGSAAGDLLDKLQGSGLVLFESDQHRLSTEGREYAVQVIRAHRLYETYLARETGLKETEWHRRAEAAEHRLTPEAAEEMSRFLGDPHFDPHGDPIPTAAGVVPDMAGFSLAECSAGWRGRILHIEDEPEQIFAEISAQGLAAGMQLECLDAKPHGLMVSAAGRCIELPFRLSRQIRVRALRPDEVYHEGVERLSDLPIGEQAAVVGLSPACRGVERSRLLDLGVVPGTIVEPDLRSAAGSPIGYRIRGATIALRREQAERILIRRDMECNEL